MAKILVSEICNSSPADFSSLQPDTKRLKNFYFQSRLVKIHEKLKAMDRHRYLFAFSPRSLYEDDGESTLIDTFYLVRI